MPKIGPRELNACLKALEIGTLKKQGYHWRVAISPDHRVLRIKRWRNFSHNTVLSVLALGLARRVGDEVFWVAPPANDNVKAQTTIIENEARSNARCSQE